MNIVDSSLFRFKTREEFFEEFGGDGWELRVLCTWSTNGTMDKFFGKEISGWWNIDFLKLWIHDYPSFYYYGFYISRDMIKPIEL